VERVLNQLQRQIDRYRTLPPTWVREPSLAANHQFLLALRPRRFRLRRAL